MRDAFFKMAGLTPSSLDQVRTMKTRRLPIPFFEGTDKYIQFTARRGQDGMWRVTGSFNMRSPVNAGVQLAAGIYSRAAIRHNGRDSYAMSFDATLLILREVEEELLKYAPRPGRPPRHHFTEAYRLLPPSFREGLDEIFDKRTGKGAPEGEKQAPAAKKPPAPPPCPPN